MAGSSSASSTPSPARHATVLDIQRALVSHGYQPGPLDGAWGARTDGALRQFQRDRGLIVDGIVGPRTKLALWPNLVASRIAVAAPSVPLWLTLAIAEIGQREASGRDSNRRIIAYRTLGRTTSDAATEDGSRPWCADFANAMLEVAGVPGTRSGLARSFERSPEFVRLAGPALGAITTFWRGAKASGKGHVNFYAGQLSSGRIIGVGGNQSDAATAAEYGTARLVAYWWPRSAPAPAIGHTPPIIRPTAREGRET